VRFFPGSFRHQDLTIQSTFVSHEGSKSSSASCAELSETRSNFGLPSLIRNHGLHVYCMIVALSSPTLSSIFIVRKLFKCVCCSHCPPP
jgi:hypothetical protein